MGRCAFTGDMLLKTWTYEAHGGEVIFVSGTSGWVCKWHYCCAVFIGLTMGLCAFLVDVLLETLNNWKFGAVNSVIRTRGGFWRPYLAYLGFCLLYSGHHCTFFDNSKGAQPHLSWYSTSPDFWPLFLLGPGMHSQAACSQIRTKDNEKPARRCIAWRYLIPRRSSWMQVFLDALCLLWRPWRLAAASPRSRHTSMASTSRVRPTPACLYHVMFPSKSHLCRACPHHFSLDEFPPCRVPVYMAGSLGRCAF